MAKGGRGGNGPGKATRATTALDKAGAAYEVLTYEYDPDADRIGEHAAAALGVPAAIMLKTLMVLVDGRPAAVIVPSDRQASMKRIASALGGKSAEMMKPADAERLTGYMVGGISPFGQKRLFPTLIEVTALDNPLVYMNGGGRGVQIRLAPRLVVELLNGKAAPIVAD